MNKGLSMPTKAVSQPSFTSTSIGLVQRKCSCGQITVAGGECAGCRQQREGKVRRAAVRSASTIGVASAVHDVLSSSEQSLDTGIQTSAKPRFEHDFSSVPVHTARREKEESTRTAPQIIVRQFSAPMSLPQNVTHDKSDSPGDGGDQDQGTSLTSFSPIKGGVSIKVEATGVSLSNPDFPDGFRWTQTIETNAPLHGASTLYVDPYPNDDTKPFYYTDAEFAANPTTFSD